MIGCWVVPHSLYELHREVGHSVWSAEQVGSVSFQIHCKEARYINTRYVDLFSLEGDLTTSESYTGFPL